MTGLKSSIAMAAAAVLAMPFTASAADIKIASFPGPKHPINAHLFEPWMATINGMNKGLDVKLYVAGKLGKGPAKQFKRAVDGVADVSFGLQGYTSKQFRATTLVELANVMTNAVDGTKRLQTAYAKSAAVRKEYEKVHVLGIWTIDVPILMTKDKPIKSIADLKGLKRSRPWHGRRRSRVTDSASQFQDQGSHPLFRLGHSVRIVTHVHRHEQKVMEQVVPGA